MKYGLALVCVVGLTGVAVSQPALDKATLAEVRKLQEKRRDVLRDMLATRTQMFLAGRATLDGIVGTSKQLLDAELELAATDGERIAAHQRHVEQARQWLEVAKAKHEAARGTEISVLDAQAVLLAAEIGLLKAGGKLKNVKK